MTTNTSLTDYNTGARFDIFNQMSDIMDLIGAVLKYVISETPAGRPIINIIAAELITIAILLGLRYGPVGMQKSDFDHYLWQICGLIIPIGVPLFIYLLSP
jgi:hypothetical protein